MARVPRKPRLSRQTTNAFGVHRRLGSDTSGGAGTLPQDHAGAVLSPRDPEDEKARCGPGAPPGTRQGLAGLSSGDHTAVFAAPAARGRVDTVAPQRAGGHDGVEEVSPSCRLHPGRCVSAGPPHLHCRRSAARLPRPPARRQALWARHHRQRTPRRTGHGAAMELSPLWGAPGGTSRRGWLPFTTSTACSITHTGGITS